MPAHNQTRGIRNLLPRLGVVLAALLFSACASTDLAVGRVPRLQQLEINSAGKKPIVDYQVRYGEHQAPLLRDRKFPGGGGENILRRVSETVTTPIPVNAEIRWKTGDGEVHQAFVPIRGLVTDAKAFHGIKILFIDDHVDVYFMYKMPTQSMYLNLKYVKAYSSTSEK